MRKAWRDGVLWLVVAIAIAAAAPLACGGTDSGTPGSGSGGSATSSNSSSSGLGGQAATLQSLSIDPAMATIESLNGAKPTQAFKVTAHASDGSTMPIAGDVVWSASSPQVGAIDGAGLYTASGSIGGVVTITASFQGLKATAELTVKLHVQQNPANVPPNVQSSLTGASTPDANVVWAYPYDGTVWPRGLLSPLLQWNGGAISDFVYVHLKNATYELEQFASPANSPSSQLAIDEPTWQAFVDSNSGATTFTVTRWDGTTATLIANHTWTIAPASMKGTVYYWSNDLGRVLRISPGAAMPDDFANQAPLNDPAQYPSSGCLMTCHTVSADGSTIVSGGGVYGGSYDLKTDKPLHSNGGVWGGGPSSTIDNGTNVRWAFSALSPTGKYILINSMSVALSQSTDGTPNPPGLFTTSDGAPVAGSGADGVFMAMPAWSPAGSRIAFVDSANQGAAQAAWADPPPGDLKVYQFDEKKSPMISGLQTLVATGADPTKRITWPTMTPDGKGILYARAASADTRGGNGDLYFTSAVTPNQEVRLAKLDGDGYPFAAGARDASWNFEPSFAPVAAGGYFWVVFTSRRTYGNVLTGDKTVVKQLWVAAIDQSPQPGKDPSHPAFHLTGQAANLAMRGFWALSPCKGDGQDCQSGTDCCGGYCGTSGDAGTLACLSQGGPCSQVGDKCATAADCCGAAQGESCINHVCSVAPPK